jgi:hypothetical protein
LRQGAFATRTRYFRAFQHAVIRNLERIVAAIYLAAQKGLCGSAKYAGSWGNPVTFRHHDACGTYAFFSRRQVSKIFQKIFDFSQMRRRGKAARLRHPWRELC